MTLLKSPKPLRKKMRVLLMISLTIALSSCATISDDGIMLSWEFLDNDEGETKACLPQESVESLRKIIIRCKND